MHKSGCTFGSLHRRSETTRNHCYRWETSKTKGNWTNSRSSCMFSSVSILVWHSPQMFESYSGIAYFAYFGLSRKLKLNEGSTVVCSVFAFFMLIRGSCYFKTPISVDVKPQISQNGGTVVLRPFLLPMLCRCMCAFDCGVVACYCCHRCGNTGAIVGGAVPRGTTRDQRARMNRVFSTAVAVLRQLTLPSALTLVGQQKR